MARVLPIHELVLTRDRKHAAGEKNPTVTAAAAAGDVDLKKMNKYWTMDMIKFNSRIFRVLKQENPDLSITCEASDVLNGILSNMMLKLIHISFKNCLRRKNSQLSVNDINAAVVEVFPPKMAKLSRQAGRKALTSLRVSRLSARMDRTMSIK